MRFSPQGEATRVELEHRGWNRYGDRGPEARGSYDGGWEQVLGAYVASLTRS